MLNVEALQNKLSCLKIPGIVESVTDNNFYCDVAIRFENDITFSKIKSRLQDIRIYFDADVELSSVQGLIILKVKKKARPEVKSSDFFRIITADNSNNYILPIAIGQTEAGKNYIFDLVKGPHILVAGSTGSGKSVFIHNCILSLLYSAQSELILVDVKRVEFSLYEGVTALKSDICYDTTSTVKMLKNLVHEMEKRFEMFKNSHVRSIQEYRSKGYHMNYITLIIDELADLMLQDKRIEPLLIRLCQLGRASGIHLILATQRPDSSILSGLIRANAPSRICFAVQKATDSRIILDQSGGENLLGAGDGLFLPIGSKTPIHFQAPFTPTKTIDKIVDMFK